MSVTTALAGDELPPEPATAPDRLSAPGRIAPSASPNSPVPVGVLQARAKPVPLSPGKYAVQFTMDEEMHEELLAVLALLGHALPSGDLAEVFRRALRELRTKLEKRKFAKSDGSRPQRGAAQGRYIPAAVRRAVWERDGGQCTFVSENGKRCESRKRLEFDHRELVARGGRASVAGIRLLCRVHNQHAADRALGGRFMEGKRQEGRERTARARAEAHAKAREQERAEVSAEAASQQEVIPWLRALGCNVETARQAATRCAGMVGAPLEKRVFAACRGLGPRSSRRALPVEQPRMTHRATGS